MSSIGLDIGRSAVKVSVADSTGKRKQFLIPTAVCLAVKISDDAEALRAEKDLVTVNGVDYFIGDTALIQGGSNVSMGLSDDWVNTAEHTALMLGAFNRALNFCDNKEPKIVMGLPTHLYSRQKQKLLETSASAFGLDPKNIRVVAQPSGPYLESLLDEDGRPLSKIDEEDWAVVEIGYFTTDFMLMKSGRWVERASGTCSGAHIAAEALQRILSKNDIKVDLMQCDEALRKKYVRNFGQRVPIEEEVDEAIEVLANEVIDTATRLIEPYARQLDGVIIAGGGAEFMYETIKKRWPHAVLPKDPRISVAEGMRRFAQMNKNIEDSDSANQE